MPYGFQILSEEPLNQIGDNYVLKRGQMLTEVKCIKVCFTIRSLGLKHHQAIKMVTALKRMRPPIRSCPCKGHSHVLFLFSSSFSLGSFGWAARPSGKVLATWPVYETLKILNTCIRVLTSSAVEKSCCIDDVC